MIVAGGTEAVPVVLADLFMDQVLGAGGSPAGKTPGWVDGQFAKLVSFVGSSEAGLDPRLRVAIVIAILVFLTSALAALTTYITEYISKYLASLVVRDLRVELLAKVVRLPFAYFTRKKMGDLMSRYSNDTMTAYQAVNIFVSELLLQPITIVWMASLAIAYNWRLALAALLFFPLVVYPVLRLGKRVHRRSKRTLETLGETVESMTQVLGGLRVVKAFRMEEAEVREHQSVNDRWLEQQAGLVRAKALGRGTMDLVWGIVLSLTMLSGSWLIVTQTWGLTPDDFVALMFALVNIFRPLKRLSSGYNLWQASMAAAGRIFEVLDEKPEVPDSPSAVPAGALKKGIELRQVSFRYELGDSDAKPVLDRVDLEIRAGTTVAIVGPSGAGKSTLANLLLRFYEPTSGAILYDGVPLTEIARDSLLARIALVSQHPFLFNSSVRENIAYGRPGATQAEIEAAAKAAYIHDVIEKLPSGYDTVVGDRGMTLSGGQLQRITIARAILRDASLLVLDEATSSLDTDSERAVQEALRNLMAGRTSVVIAHRLSTIVHADRIVVLDEGRVVESGSHAELLALGGRYSRLLAAQNSGG